MCREYPCQCFESGKFGKCLSGGVNVRKRQRRLIDSVSMNDMKEFWIHSPEKGLVMEEISGGTYFSQGNDGARILHQPSHMMSNSIVGH